MDYLIDIFCGAGGLSLGFADNNLKAIGIDCSDPKITKAGKFALETYQENLSHRFGKLEIIDINIMHLDPAILPKKPKYYIGSPPCQPFSISNRLKTLDPTLVIKYLKVKDVLKPEIWVMEEVPKVGIIGKANQWFKPRYLEARDFGLPHVRRRLYAGNYIEPSKNSYKGYIIPFKKKMGIYIGYLFKTPVSEIRGYGHGKKDRLKIKYDFWRLAQLLKKKKYVNTPTAKEGAGETGYLAGVTNDFCKYGLKDEKFSKIVTPQLCQFIMGFPADYKFSGTNKMKYRQIGNAVCPPISLAIKKACENQDNLDGYIKLKKPEYPEREYEIKQKYFKFKGGDLILQLKQLELVY